MSSYTYIIASISELYSKSLSDDKKELLDHLTIISIYLGLCMAAKETIMNHDEDGIVQKNIIQSIQLANEKIQEIKNKLLSQ